MDKTDAFRLTAQYLKKVTNSGIHFREAWIFGSYINGSQNENSDIDLAIVLDDSEVNLFDTEVKLMIIRKGEETIIEPHVFNNSDFNTKNPFFQQIISNGLKISS
jgi:predicted nucleotidyltransferase